MLGFMLGIAQASYHLVATAPDAAIQELHSGVKAACHQVVTLTSDTAGLAIVHMTSAWLWTSVH